MKNDLFERLAAPFPVENIHWRVSHKTKDGKRALALAYIDARDVMDRLDEVVGPAYWEDTYCEVMGRMVCRLTLTLKDEDGVERQVTKEDGADDTQIEAAKGGLSDAFKRAGVKWGIGRYLYRLGNTWVELDEKGNFAPSAQTVFARALGQVSGGVAPQPAAKPAPAKPTSPVGQGLEAVAQILDTQVVVPPAIDTTGIEPKFFPIHPENHEGKEKKFLEAVAEKQAALQDIPDGQGKAVVAAALELYSVNHPLKIPPRLRRPFYESIAAKLEELLQLVPAGQQDIDFP